MYKFICSKILRVSIAKYRLEYILFTIYAHTIGRLGGKTNVYGTTTFYRENRKMLLSFWWRKSYCYLYTYIFAFMCDVFVDLTKNVYLKMGRVGLGACCWPQCYKLW